ncbi:ABC transporter permease [Micromonospora sp. CPCC 205371]|nr:ABC transporter permease [Micromonospora sp. CPCC 205371]
MGLVWRITRLNFRAVLEYRAEFMLKVAVGAAWQISVVVFATVLLTRFPGMGGWATSDVLLLASMRLLSHGLYVLLLGRVTWTHIVVQLGQIDAFMLRPMPVYRQVQLAFFNVNAVGDLLVAASLFVGAVLVVDVDWTPARIAYLVVALVGGVLAEGAIGTALGSAALHAPATAYWSMWLDELMTAFGNYPLHILPGLVRDAFTFVLPLAFVAYLPAAVLTGHLETLAVPGWLAVASPLIGLLAYLASRLLWKRSLRAYKGYGGT